MASSIELSSARAQTVTRSDSKTKAIPALWAPGNAPRSLSCSEAKRAVSDGDSAGPESPSASVRSAGAVLTDGPAASDLLSVAGSARSITSGTSSSYEAMIARMETELEALNRKKSERGHMLMPGGLTLEEETRRRELEGLREHTLKFKGGRLATTSGCAHFQGGGGGGRGRRREQATESADPDTLAEDGEQMALSNRTPRRSAGAKGGNVAATTVVQQEISHQGKSSSRGLLGAAPKGSRAQVTAGSLSEFVTRERDAIIFPVAVARSRKRRPLTGSTVENVQKAALSPKTPKTPKSAGRRRAGARPKSSSTKARALSATPRGGAIKVVDDDGPASTPSHVRHDLYDFARDTFKSKQERENELYERSRQRYIKCLAGEL